MKTFRILGALALGASAVAFLPTAAMADDTTTTFSLTGGSLTLAVQGTATLTDATTGTTAITGNLGAVSVTDLRGGTAIWSTSGESTAFTGALGSSSTAVIYTAGTITETGTITVADGTATALTATAASVVAPSSLSGSNTASWDPTLDVTMPAGALVDDYSGTVTTSVL